MSNTPVLNFIEINRRFFVTNDEKVNFIILKEFKDGCLRVIPKWGITIQNLSELVLGCFKESSKISLCFCRFFDIPIKKISFEFNGVLIDVIASNTSEEIIQQYHDKIENSHKNSLGIDKCVNTLKVEISSVMLFSESV